MRYTKILSMRYDLYVTNLFDPAPPPKSPYLPIFDFLVSWLICLHHALEAGVLMCEKNVLMFLPFRWSGRLM